MEKINIICVGGLKENYLKQMSAEYEKRLSRFCKLKITELAESRLPENPTDREIERALEKEADMMLSAAGTGGFRVALCIEGKPCGSEAFAKKIEQGMQRDGVMTLFIGSSHGMSERVKAACDMRFSMSELTFPHQLARCMLLEQVYRTYKIRRNESYHK